MDDHVLDHAESYCQNALDASTRSDVDRHLAQCEECRAAFADIALAIRELAAWTKTPAIDPALETRLVNLRPRAPRPWWSMAAAAVVAAMLAGGAGYAVGRQASPGEPAIATVAADTALRTFLLLLEEPAWPPPQPLANARTGYMDWVTDLRTLGRYVGAEKLTEEPGVRISPNGTAEEATGPSPARNLSGWYLLRARDYDEAVVLARRGPHLRYGSILVRQLE
jgi:hypothetical protein